MIAGPSRLEPGLAMGEQAAHDVTVRVQDTNLRDA